MLSHFRFPIRLKVLVTLLPLTTAVVSVIIVSMANLFNTDKTTYIRDLTSVIALHVADEAQSMLKSYHERLGAFAVLVNDSHVNPDRKRQIIEDLLKKFTDFVAIGISVPGSEPVLIYSAKALESADMTKADLLRFQKEHPLTAEQIRALPIYVENATMKSQLPLLRLALIQPLTGAQEPAIITALIRLDEMLRLATRPSPFRTFIIDANGALLVDADVERVVGHAVADWIPQLSQFELLGTTIEYQYNGEPMIGALAQIVGGRLLAAVQIPKAAAYLTARTLLRNLLLLALALLVATGFVSAFLAHRLTRPLERLTEAARQVGQGYFDIVVHSSSRDEIGVLSGAFTQMAAELRQRLRDLRQAQAALVQSEKMSAFGQLSAGIAHEVKNPLAGILGHAQLCLRKLRQDDPLYNHISVVEQETKRCTEIITNLMKFAHQEKTEFEPVDLNDVIKHAVALLDHQLSINQIKTELNLAPNLPLINGNGNQLQQVLMNFAINAQQAMEGKPGTVRVTTRRRGDKVLMVFGDNGPGIQEEIRNKIFEPFFTTKPAGQGTGLGLSVTYGIIKDHRADIVLETKLGIGTEFVITFPGIVDEIVIKNSAA